MTELVCPALEKKHGKCTCLLPSLRCAMRQVSKRPYLRALTFAALLRLCGQTLSEDSMNHLKLLANLHHDYFSRPTRHSVRKIRMKIATSIQHITIPTNPPTRASFGHSPQPQTSGTPSYNRARSLWPPRFSNRRRYPGREKVSLPSRSILPRSTTQPTYMTRDG